MAKYRIETAGGTYEVETAETAQAQQPDVGQKALDYRTGNDFVDAPLGVVQGAVKGLREHVYSTAEAIHKIPGVGAVADRIDAAMGQKPWTQADSDRIKQETEARGIGQSAGKFLESAAEFALPSGAVGKALKGAGLAARAIGQAAVGAGVAGAQSGGDPTSIATGAALGGAGEVVGAAGQAAKKLFSAKAPTLANFAESFGKATPRQKAVISDALPTLERDGIAPAGSLQEMHGAVTGKLDSIRTAYQDLDPAIKQRTTSPAQLVKSLRDKQAEFTRRGVVTDKSGYDAVQQQIDTVTDIAKQNNGRIDLDDIVHLKQRANGKTNFNSTDAEEDLWKGIGDSYRGAADRLAPETTPLNKDYARYSQLEKITAKNLKEGKGNTDSGLDHLLRRAAGHGVGAAVGADLGHAVAGAPGAAVGGLVGGIAGPRLTKAVTQAVQNAVDSGSLKLCR